MLSQKHKFVILQARWGSPVLYLFSGQGLHPCQRSSKCYHICWASGELFEILISNGRKLLMCRVLERPPRALSLPITIKRRDGKWPLFAQILSGHLKSVLKFLENAILGLAHTTNWSKMQPKQPFLWVLHRGVYWSLKQKILKDFFSIQVDPVVIASDGVEMFKEEVLSSNNH